MSKSNLSKLSTIVTCMGLVDWPSRVGFTLGLSTYAMICNDGYRIVQTTTTTTTHGESKQCVYMDCTVPVCMYNNRLKQKIKARLKSVRNSESDDDTGAFQRLDTKLSK